MDENTEFLDDYLKTKAFALYSYITLKFN